MAKRNRIVATYRLNDSELLQVNVDVDNAYPEAVDVACANARQLLADVLADVLELTRDPEPNGAES